MITMESRRSKIAIKTTDSLAIVPLQIKNMGKRNYKLKTVLKDKPTGLKTFNSDLEFMLNAKGDTLIEFRFQPEKNWSNVHTAVMDFRLTDAKSGEEIKKCKVSAFPMGHIKKYYYPDFMINNTHEFGLGIQNSGGSQNQIELSGNGKRPFRNGLLSYQLNSFYYASTHDLNIVNSFVNFSKEHRSLTIGNVTQNDEISLAGRGFLLETEKDSLAIYLGYFNGAYGLFEKSSGADSSTGNSITGGFRRPYPKVGWIEGAGMLQLQKEANTGLFWVTQTLNKKRNKIRTRIGLSGRQDKSIISTGIPVQTGWGLSTDYEKEHRNWTFQSDNYFSSPDYSGDVSGYLGSYNKFNFTGFKKINWNVSTRINRSKNFTQVNEQSMVRLGKIFSYKLQLETKNIGNWRFVLAPYQLVDRRNFVDHSNKNTFYNSKSTRVSTIISRKKGNSSMTVKSDFGYFAFGKAGGDQNRILAYRLGFNFSTKSLGINSGYNHGSERLSSALEYEQSGISPAHFFLNARWGKWFFKRVLKINCSNQLAFNSIRQVWTNSSSLKFKTSLPRGLEIQSEVAGFKNNNFFDVFWNIKATKKIGKYHPPGGAQKLKIFPFEDSNNNGKREEEEPCLSGIFIEIDEVPLVTGAGGWVEYKAVPIRQYNIKIIDPSGNLSGAPRQIMVEKNMEAYFPMYKTIALTGKVKEIKQRFKSSKFDLLGIPIIVKNIQEEVFLTYTKPDGSFAINLPQNEYTVYIDTKAFGKNFEFPENFKKVTLEQGKASPPVALSVKVKSRKMNIKKF